MACGVKRGEVAAHAGADQRHGFAAGRILDHCELAGDGEMFEIAGSKIEDLDGSAGGRQQVAKIVALLDEGLEAKPCR